MKAPTILLVEDEQQVAISLREQLTLLGYDVPDAVSTGDDALRRIEEAPPDLILMDITLKGDLDGITTVSKIPPAYQIPVIYLTAHSGDATLTRAAATNPYGYLLKPFSERELHAMIQMALTRCRADRAARVMLERRLQTRKMDSLRELAGGVAEEVDSLLTVLYRQLEIFGHHALREPALTEPIRDAFDEAIEKELLVRRLLDFSGRRELRPTTVSIDDFLIETTSQLQNLVCDDVRVRSYSPAGLWSARIDPGRLARALSNLAVNARDAMPDGGNLTIEAHNALLGQSDVDGQPDIGAGRYVVLSVADTGIGMTDDVMGRAFEPFFTARPGGGGEGMGLSLVFGFIHQSGGHISIASKPGEGTTVTLWIPAAAGSASSAETSAPQGFHPLSLPDTDITVPPPDRAVLPPITEIAPGQRDGGGPPREVPAETPRGGTQVSWHHSENALFATMASPQGSRNFRLIVEPLPNRQGWDWTVWRQGNHDEASRHGRAPSVIGAMAAAEDATRRWDQSAPTEG